MPSTLDPDEQKSFDRHYKEANALAEPLMMLKGRKRRFILNKRARANKAIKHFKACLEIAPDHWPTMWLLGKLYQAMDEPKVALQLFLRVMKLEENNPEAAREASISAMTLGLIDVALDCSAEAMRRNPEDAGLACNHAVHLMVAERDAEAAEVIAKAHDMAPQDELIQRVKQLVADVASGKEQRPRHDALG